MSNVGNSPREEIVNRVAGKIGKLGIVTENAAKRRDSVSGRQLQQDETILTLEMSSCTVERFLDSVFWSFCLVFVLLLLKLEGA